MSSVSIIFLRAFQPQCGNRGVRPPASRGMWHHAALAETKGFEPLIRLPVYTISSRTHSTTLPRLRTCVIIQISFLFASDFDLA